MHVEERGSQNSGKRQRRKSGVREEGYRQKWMETVCAALIRLWGEKAERMERAMDPFQELITQMQRYPFTTTNTLHKCLKKETVKTWHTSEFTTKVVNSLRSINL